MRDGEAKPLTVLMTADAIGGVWNYSLSLCAALPEMRFVLAVIGPLPSPAQRAAASRLGNVILEEYGHRLEWMQGAAKHLGPSRHWLAMLARRHGADLLHVNGYAHAVNDAGLPTVAVAHSDVLSWWRAVHGEAAPAEWDPYWHEVMAGLHAADRVVAPTAAVLDDLARHYGFRRHRGLVIANGIDVAAYAPRPKRAVVMAAGRLWDAAKNLSVLDEIGGELDWPVEIAGDPAHPESGAVRFATARLLGVLTPADIAAAHGEAAVFAAPARYEPFGLSILEAAASGCALVLGDIPSLRESWDGAALFVPPDDRAAWRSTLGCLIADDGRREGLGAAARQRACRFTGERMAARYAALYKQLTTRGDLEAENWNGSAGFQPTCQQDAGAPSVVRISLLTAEQGGR
jgi:glycogen(starch) synthase